MSLTKKSELKHKIWSGFLSIRFKLTLLNSVILFFFSALLVVSLNLYLNSYLTSDPILKKPPQIVQQFATPYGNTLTISFNDLQAAERIRIKEVRKDDLEQIQALSLIALIPSAILSFILGYFVSGYFLRPLSKLGKEFDALETKDLGKTIPIEVDDEVGHLIGSFNNLSERLRSSFWAQERFVQDAAHELKTPLTVIQTSLDTVVYDKTATREELQASIGTALLGMKNVRRLTDYLLQLSETESTQKENIDLNNLVLTQVDSLAPFALEHQVQVENALPEEIIQIKGDSFLLGRALTNLIENAIKYSAWDKTNAENAELIPETAKVKISLEKTTAKLVRITVNDNGPGIAPEYQNKIFQRFFRVDKSRSRKSGGFGLGLAIAKKIVTEHKGSLKLESEPGNTSFIIELPL